MQGSLIEWLTMLGEWGIVGAILYEGRIALGNIEAPDSLMLSDTSKLKNREKRGGFCTKRSSLAPRRRTVGGREMRASRTLRRLPVPDTIFLAR